MIKAIFFDAGETLIRLTKSVGWHYAIVAQRLGLELDRAELDHGFAQVWKEMPVRPATGQPREDDDKGWWRDLVERLLDRMSARVDPREGDKFFEAAYSHFAEPGVWELYPEVIEVLDILAPHYELAIVSNFDGRLRTILEQLKVSRYFSRILVSSELGVDKPDPFIYGRALEIIGCTAEETLHAGDDPIRDWLAAKNAGLATFRLERPQNSLRELVARLRVEMNYRKT